MARLLIVDDNLELAKLVAATARSRGHAAVAVHTGEEAIARAGDASFDFAIVDLLLPDVKGSTVLGELHKRRIPTMAVSGVYKGARFAREAVEQHGASAFFEKPFELVALLEAIEKITGRPTPAEELPELELNAEDEAPPSVPPLAPSDRAAAPPADGDPLEAALGPREPTPLPFADRGHVWNSDEPPAPAPGHPPPSALPSSAATGAVSPGTVARLLNAYYLARHTGELQLRQGAVTKVVYFEQGRPIYAASNVAGERFARFCERKGLLKKTQLEAVTALAKQKGIKAAEEMMRVGLLTFEQRLKLTEEQVKEIIWSTFGWESGSYAFARKKPDRTGWLELAIFPGNLIFEGVFKTEKLIGLRAKMGGGRRLFPVADPPYGLHQIALTGPQAMLLAYADGTKTVEDILQLTDLSERDALATLLAFELLGLVEERRDDNKQRRISYGI